MVMLILNVFHVVRDELSLLLDLPLCLISTNDFVLTIFTPKFNLFF